MAARSKRAIRQHGNVPLLADVAQVELAHDPRVCRGKALAGQRVAGLLLELAKDGLGFLDLRAVELVEEHPDIVVPHVGLQHAQRAEGAGQARQ